MNEKRLLREFVKTANTGTSDLEKYKQIIGFLKLRKPELYEEIQKILGRHRLTPKGGQLIYEAVKGTVQILHKPKDPVQWIDKNINLNTLITLIK